MAALIDCLVYLIQFKLKTFSLINQIKNNQAKINQEQSSQFFKADKNILVIWTYCDTILLGVKFYLIIVFWLIRFMITAVAMPTVFLSASSESLIQLARSCEKFVGNTSSFTELLPNSLGVNCLTQIIYYRWNFCQWKLFTTIELLGNYPDSNRLLNWSIFYDFRCSSDLLTALSFYLPCGLMSYKNKIHYSIIDIIELSA